MLAEISAARKAVATRYDAGYVPDKPRFYATKPPQPEDAAKGAAEKPEAQRAEGTPEASGGAARQPERGQPDTSEAPSPGLNLDIDTTAASEALAAPKEEEGAQERTNARRRSAGNTSSVERSRKMTSRIFLVGTALLVVYVVWMLGRDLDQEEMEKFHEEESVRSFFGRLKLRIQAMREGMTRPVWDKLLPDPLPFPYSRPYTLVIDLDQLLVASSWSTAQGWRTAKRPGLDYFLGYLSQWYEIVLWTSQPFYIVEKTIEKLDPDRRYFAYQLFREACRLQDGKLVKDIRHLNRDPSKVVILDINPDHVSLQPENAVIMEPWKGNRDDRELVGMIPFLEAIGIYHVPDVRKTLKAYEGRHIPTEHMQRELELKKKHEDEWHAKKQRLGGFSSLFGGVSSGVGHSEPPKTWVEQERARFQQGYMEDQKFWRENGEKLRQQMKEEQDKQLREMKLNAWDGVSRMFAGPPPQPSEEAPKNAPA